MSTKNEEIEELQKLLLVLADELRKDTKISLEDKLSKVDVILNTYKFLQKYDYNIELLQKDLEKKRYEREK